jgi:hypothetical protein
MQLLQVAQQLEQVQDRQTAMRMYETVLRDPNSQPADAEAALFRYCVCCEGFGWWDKAANGYDQILRHNAFGPFGQQAKARLDHIKGRSAVRS